MKTIIIHETDKSVLDILTLALEIENFKVYSFQDCETNFLEIIRKLNPQVVMLDYRLDGKNSREILQCIKGSYPILPVIAMSCNSNISTVAYGLGFDGYIEKPFDLDFLYWTLGRHMPQVHPNADSLIATF